MQREAEAALDRWSLVMAMIHVEEMMVSLILQITMVRYLVCAQKPHHNEIDYAKIMQSLFATWWFMQLQKFNMLLLLILSIEKSKCP